MRADHAYVVEVFSSLQGEGPRLGERQVFLRLGGCNLCCDYCDEPETIPVPSGTLLPAAEIRDRVEALLVQRPHASVSVTGGEPLMQARFLSSFLPWVRAKALLTYLETNGTLPQALARLVACVDAVAMDVKLPSATGKDCWDRHREFLRVSPAKTFVKVVVTASSTVEEVLRAARLVRDEAPAAPFVLQPATAYGGARPPDGRAMLELYRRVREVLPGAQLLPQWHALWRLP